MRVLVAMSGGVDSSVAAARMVEAGHDVVGVHLALSAAPGTLRTGARGCCSKEDAGDARRVADVLDIPFYVWDFADRFSEAVIDDFVSSYARGETPNPCVRCNERIKFSALAARALALGFDAVATGHYARLSDGRLRRAVDRDKDQSYVLGVLTAEQLRHAVFPIGDTPKSQIRLEAARRGLAVAEKPDSHDICFIPSGDTRAFLGARIGVRRGTVIDAGGTVLAEHDGVHGFTIGQRKGLGIAGPRTRGAAPLRHRHRCRHRHRACWRRRGVGRLDANWGPARVHLRRCTERPGGVRGAGASARRHRRRRRRTARRAAGGGPARPAARGGAGPDDGALLPRSRWRRGHRQRDDHALVIGRQFGTLARMFVITMSGTDGGKAHEVTSTRTTFFTR